MNVAILGTNQHSQIVANLIEQNYNSWLEQRLGEKINVVAYVTLGVINTSNINNVPILNFVQIVLLYHKKLIDKIIFPREVLINQRNVMLNFMSSNVKLDDIYLTSRLNDNISVFNFIEQYTLSRFLPYLEFHIADHCNLNCHACEHYSSLVKEPKFPVLEKFIEDFNQLHKFIDDIGTIRIMGGEPLLNPQINEYIKLARQLYPFADIRVVTNAILLKKMSEDFFDALRKFNVGIDISVYPPMKSKIPEIQNLMRSKAIQSEIHTDPKDEFFKRRSLKPHSHLSETFFTDCGAAMCNFLYDGKIAPCSRPFTLKYFNEYFKQNLPTEGKIDLYNENLTTEKLIRQLLKPIPACAHCGQKKVIKWKPASYPAKLSDWVVDDYVTD